MDDEDKKLLELYQKNLRKKKIIMVVIAVVVVFIALIISSIYYKHSALNISKNTQEKIEETNEIENSKDENVMGIQNEIIEENNIVDTNEVEIIEDNNNQDEQINIQEQNIESKIIEDTSENTELKETKVNEIKNTNENKENTKVKLVNKDFLFTDGYTMDNVTQAAQDYLKSSGASGECIPIKDEEGVYIGMRVIFY